MSRISQTKKNPVTATKGPENKAKVKQGEYTNLKHRFKCHGCGWSYDTKMDLTQHNALHHAQRNCIICNAQAELLQEKAPKKKKKRNTNITLTKI